MIETEEEAHIRKSNMFNEALMSLTKDDIPFTVIHSFRRLESETKENEDFQIDDMQSVKRKLDFSDEALDEDQVTPDKPKSVYKSQLHDRWKKILRIQD